MWSSGSWQTHITNASYCCANYGIQVTKMWDKTEQKSRVVLYSCSLGFNRPHCNLNVLFLALTVTLEITNFCCSDGNIWESVGFSRNSTYLKLSGISVWPSLICLKLLNHKLNYPSDVWTISLRLVSPFFPCPWLCCFWASSLQFPGNSSFPNTLSWFLSLDCVFHQCTLLRLVPRYSILCILCKRLYYKQA